MQRVIVDDILRERLGNLSQPVELCDNSGQVLGHVIPVLDLSKYEPWEPEFSEEELRETEASTEWYTTQEVLAHLKGLEKS